MALEGEQHLRHLVGHLGPDDPAADADGRVIGLVGDALGQLQAPTQQPLKIQVYDRLLLTESGSLAQNRG